MLNKMCFFVITLFLVSCNNTKTPKESSQLPNTTNTTKKSVNSIGETLTPEAKKVIENWEEYKIVDETLNEFYSITTDDALLKAKDLSISIQQFRDSIRIEKLERPDIKIRLNVLYNYSLRLADMATITSIKPQEVKIEITNILQAFSAINSKINNLTNQEKLEAEVKTIDFE